MLDEETKAALIHIAQTGQCDDVENQYGDLAPSGANVSIRQILVGGVKLRIKKRRPIIAPEIWKVLPAKYTCLAWDENGKCYAMGDAKAEYGRWLSDVYTDITEFSCIDLNGCDWRESLCERPE